MRVANAPVSWGVMEFDFEGQSYEFGQVLDEIRSTGYQGTELGEWGFLPTEPEQLRREIEARDLELVGAFVPVDLRRRKAHEDGTRRALRAAELLAGAFPEAEPLLILSDDNGNDPARTEIAGRVRPQDGLDGEEWATFVEGTEGIAEQVRKEVGLRTAFHHHCAGYVEAPWEVRRLMKHTDPELVGLCLDTGHFRFGGGNPVRAVDEYSDRIWHVHLKDFSPLVAARAASEGWGYFEAVENGVFCELGEGDVDFPAIVAALREVDYGGWIVVEQDILPGMGAPRESAGRNREYLEQIGVIAPGEETRSASA